MLKEWIKDLPALGYVIDALELLTSAGRRQLLAQPMLTEAAALEREYDNIKLAMSVLAASGSAVFSDPVCRQAGCVEKDLPAANPTPDVCRQAVIDFRHCLMELHDIQGTITALASGVVLSEVDLFEVKKLAHLNARAIVANAAFPASIVSLPDLAEVFAILDPDATGVPHFYIYDSYDARLTPLRKQLREAADNAEKKAELMSQHDAIQQEVMERLSTRLKPFSHALEESLQKLAYADILLAKAQQATQWKLVRPTIQAPDSQLIFEGLWEPRLRDHNLSEGLRYQPVDVRLGTGLTIVSGANMSGKTVLLKTVALAQLMAQHGFFVPAASAAVPLVDDVAICMGDGQDEMSGLSSFAWEIGRISDILRRSRRHRLLILIDEPARTTNPVEGLAIVQALCRLLADGKGISVVTTHYSGLKVNCRRLRVRGFVEDMERVPLTPQSINRFIDYSLLEDDNATVPHEALRIATLLGADAELLRLAGGEATQQEANL